LGTRVLSLGGGVKCNQGVMLTTHPHLVLRSTMRILGGNSTDSKRVFYILKGIIRIMAAAKRRPSCRDYISLIFFH
jgi:hypothetical protein